MPNKKEGIAQLALPLLSNENSTSFRNQDLQQLRQLLYYFKKMGACGGGLVPARLQEYQQRRWDIFNLSVVHYFWPDHQRGVCRDVTANRFCISRPPFLMGREIERKCRPHTFLERERFQKRIPGQEEQRQCETSVQYE